MCKENREYFLILFVGLLLSLAAGVLQAEEQWYLISETELLSIERYKEKSEQEKQTWLLQAQLLNREAGLLHQESMSLNNQLSQAREQNMRLEKSFNEYEADQLQRLSLKNGEIASLKQDLSAEKLEKERYKAVSRIRLVVIIAMACSWVLFLGFKLYWFIRRP
jgi:hypothetical protein